VSFRCDPTYGYLSPQRIYRDSVGIVIPDFTQVTGIFLGCGNTPTPASVIIKASGPLSY
jgi:hypothetical protein